MNKSPRLVPCNLNKGGTESTFWWVLITKGTINPRAIKTNNIPDKTRAYNLCRNSFMPYIEHINAIKSIMTITAAESK